jgi:hypothetical protein
VNGKEDEAGESRRGGKCEHPAREERQARGDWQWVRLHFRNGRLGEVDDGAAIGASCEMGECRLLLVKWQGVLDEGIELVCVGMLAGLEVDGHLVAGGGLVAGCVRVA